MKIKCLHGYFILEETKVGQAAEFMTLFGVDLALRDGYFTFDDLVDAPDYAIAGGLYLGGVVTKTFEGNPWDIMRANSLVYDFSDGLVKPIAIIKTMIQLSATSRYFLTNGMILPGSITDDGSRVKDYVAHYSFAKAKFTYSEVGFE